MGKKEIPRKRNNLFSKTFRKWYVPVIRYNPDELGGLSITRFCEAMRAEGVSVNPGVNRPLHTHPVHTMADVYHDGKPTYRAFSDRDIRKDDKDLSVSSIINEQAFFLPWFKHYRPEIIDQYIAAFKKVVENHKDLLEGDKGNQGALGGWFRFNHAKKA